MQDMKMQDLKMLDTKIGGMKQYCLLALKLPGASSQRCNLVYARCVGFYSAPALLAMQSAVIALSLIHI